MADEDRTPEECLEASLERAKVRRERNRESAKRFREANKEHVRESQKEWAAKNAAKLKEQRRIYYLANKDRILAEQKAKREAQEAADPTERERRLARMRAHAKSNPERVKELRAAAYAKKREEAIGATREWRKSNPEKYKAQQEKYQSRSNHLRRKYHKTNPSFRILNSLRSTIRQAFRLQSLKKRTSTIELIGCSIEELKAHLEAQFQPGMTWENYGYRGWHIDHVRPCASFDLTNPEQQKACFRYTNLQPLWREDNQKKSARLDWRPSHEVAPGL